MNGPVGLDYGVFIRDSINVGDLGTSGGVLSQANSIIKAAPIMAGARTLAGALVPLVGPAPTRFGTEGGWNYNRKTGTAGNGTNNYLNTGRNNNADPQNNKHVSVFLTAAQSGAPGIHLGTNAAAVPGTCQIASDLTASTTNFSVNNTSVQSIAAASPDTGFLGASRSVSSSFTSRRAGTNTNAALTSNTPDNISTFVFCRNGNAVFSNARIACYSIGESLDLALLDARVTALINAIAAAIP
jgi:hypothetical protein